MKNIHQHQSSTRRRTIHFPSGYTPRARRLLESLHPCDQAILLRLARHLASSLERPAMRNATGALSRLAKLRSLSTLLSPTQQREFSKWEKREAKHWRVKPTRP